MGGESIAGEAEPSQQAAVEGRESTAVGETAEPVAPVVAASAGLSYGNAAFELSEGAGGNANEMLKDVLEEMSLDGMVSERMDCTSLHPARWKRNRALLCYCFELVAFAGNKEDIKILAKGGEAGADRGIVEAAAFRLENAAHGKMLEVEDSSLELNAQQKQPKKATVLALGKRVLEYKGEIWVAQGKPGGNRGKGATRLMEKADLRALQPGTPPGQRNVMSYFQNNE